MPVAGAVVHKVQSYCTACKRVPSSTSPNYRPTSAGPRRRCCFCRSSWYPRCCRSSGFPPSVTYRVFCVCEEITHRTEVDLLVGAAVIEIIPVTRGAGNDGQLSGVARAKAGQLGGPVGQRRSACLAIQACRRRRTKGAYEIVVETRSLRTVHVETYSVLL